MEQRHKEAGVRQRHTYSILSIALRHPQLFSNLLEKVNSLVKTLEERKKK